MEKQWEEDITKCPQYTYGLISPFIEKFDFEDDETKFDESKFYYPDSDDSFNEYKCDNTYPDIIKFLKEVRESRGYDVDTMVPSRFGSTFRPLCLEVLKDERIRAGMLEALLFALGRINAESEEKTGKTYEFVDFEKIVEADTWVILFTFKAKVRSTNDEKTLQAMVYYSEGGCCGDPELLDWRVKPVPVPPTAEDA